MTITSALQRVSTRTWAATAVVTAVIAIPASLLAWGPTRPTYTMGHPADHVTFNSITDNPAHGDERNFVQIRNVTDNGKFGENVTLTAGKEYEVYAFYHNNASTELNDAAHNYVGIAHGAYMRAELPASVAAGTTGRVNGYVGASNASPKEVWDEAFMKNDSGAAMDLRIVPGSAKITSNGAVNGAALPDALYTTGTSLGYTKLDGELPGCTQYSGYVTYRFKADQPNFTVEKTVAAHGSDQFVENINAKSGDLVDFRIRYQNTGTTQQDGVVLRDQLPANLTYVAGSTSVLNSTTNGWKAVSENTIAGVGVNIGSYAAGGAGYIKFTAKVANADAMKCGVNTITNTASADTDNGSKSDTAIVTVNKECEQPKPVEACNLDTHKVEQNVDKTKIDNIHYTTDLSKCAEQPKPETTTACKIDTKTTVTVEKSKIDNVHYTTDMSKCATPVTPTTPATPSTPAELPHTGIADGVMSVLGLGSLVGVASAYIASRRSLNQ